jgi:hypothetical protein
LVFCPFIWWKGLRLGPQLAAVVVKICGWVGDWHRTAWILAQPMKSDPVFQMGKEKMIPVIALGTPFKVEILLHEHLDHDSSFQKDDLLNRWVQNGW